MYLKMMPTGSFEILVVPLYASVLLTFNVITQIVEGALSNPIVNPPFNVAGVLIHAVPADPLIIPVVTVAGLGAVINVTLVNVMSLVVLLLA